MKQIIIFLTCYAIISIVYTMPIPLSPVTIRDTFGNLIVEVEAPVSGWMNVADGSRQAELHTLTINAGENADIMERQLLIKLQAERRELDTLTGVLNNHDNLSVDQVSAVAERIRFLNRENRVATSFLQNRGIDTEGEIPNDELTPLAMGLFGREDGRIFPTHANLPMQGPN
jgi:hypothetical protein